MDPMRLQLNAEDIHDDEPGIWGVCVAAEDDMDVEAIARQGSIPHAKIMTSTVGVLRSRGYNVLMTPLDGPVRALLTLPLDEDEVPTADDWERLRECFDGPVENTARR